MSDDSTECIRALNDSIEEKVRGLCIRRGIDPDARRPTIEELRAETIRLRAANDQAHAAMVGRRRTYD